MPFASPPLGFRGLDRTSSGAPRAASGNNRNRARKEAVRVRHKRWKLVLHAKELVYGIVVPLKFLSLRLHSQEPIQHGGRKSLRGSLFLERVLVQLRQVFAQPLELSLLLRGRFVVEPGVMPRDPKLLDQSEVREQFRLIEENFDKDFLVERIQAPWPKPDQVNEKDCGHDEEDRNDSAKPLQDTLEHRRENSDRALAVNGNFARRARDFAKLGHD